MYVCGQSYYSHKFLSIGCRLSLHMDLDDSSNPNLKWFCLIILEYFIFQVPKEYPFNNLYLERGGDPDKDPSEEVLHPDQRIIPRNLYGS